MHAAHPKVVHPKATLTGTGRLKLAADHGDPVEVAIGRADLAHDRKAGGHRRLPMVHEQAREIAWHQW